MVNRIVELGNRIFALRYGFFDQTIGLVVADGACLVVDTRTTSPQAHALQEDVRRITRHPWVVLNTHHHYDHTFGNAAFRPAEIWGHERCASTLRERGEIMRDDVIRDMPELAEDLRQIEIVPPTRTIDTGTTIDVGGRAVVLHHLGRGHTDNDVVAVVPDAAVVFAGDLVEEGAPPSFTDSFPLDWTMTGEHLLRLATGPVVPGHGEVVDAAFVRGQLEELRAAAEAARRAWAAGTPAERAGHDVPFPQPHAGEFLQRAFAQLDGRV
jgi:glyoxylase-like metal-dependent hydrolase (beta-lactamase superfamily II)